MAGANSSAHKASSERRRTPRIRNPQIIDALLCYSFSVATQVSMQNLVNYAVGCLDELQRQGNLEHTVFEYFIKSVNGIDQLYKKLFNTIPQEIRHLLYEFIDESSQIISILKSYQESQASPVRLLLVSKTTRVQWVSVCILEELKLYSIPG